MSKVDAPWHDPVPIGVAAAPPFVRLAAPISLFAGRTQRLRTLARGHELSAYLLFLASLTEAQYRIQDDLPPIVMPDALSRERARSFAMPPLDRNCFTPDAAFDATLDQLLSLVRTIEMRPEANAALASVINLDMPGREALVRALLTNSVPSAALAEHVFVAAALQVHFARLAAGLDPKGLGPVGDGACPACGGPPVSSLVVGWQGAHGTRFCACPLCGTLWNVVRIKCSLCGSTKGIGYQEIDGGAGTIKAETCDNCRSYVKILHQHKDAALDPVADDVATLGLDLLVRELGYRRGAFNPFLLGY